MTNGRRPNPTNIPIVTLCPGEHFSSRRGDRGLAADGAALRVPSNVKPTVLLAGGGGAAAGTPPPPRSSCEREGPGTAGSRAPADPQRSLSESRRRRACQNSRRVGVWAASDSDEWPRPSAVKFGTTRLRVHGHFIWTAARIRQRRIPKLRRSKPLQGKNSPGAPEGNRIATVWRTVGLQ